MTSIAFEPVLGSLLAVIAVAAAGAVLLWTVRPAGSNISPRRMRWLMGVRLAALVLLILGLLRPAWVRTDSRPTAAAVAVLLDHSRSMTLPDGEGQSRWDTERRVVEQLRAELDSLDDDLEIQYYQFGADAERLSPEAIGTFLQSPPDSPQTDLATALRASLAGTAGRPLAGVVMISDGTSTVPRSNPASGARTLASLEVPLWTVPIGPVQADAQLRDVAVVELPESFRVFSKNLFRVTATVRTRGLSGRDVPVRITLVDEEGNESELATRSIVPQGADDSSLLDVELAAPPPGSYRLNVAATPQPGEVLTENNQQIAFLDVREGGGRILYIEGQPRVEQLFLRRSINESPDLELDELWIGPESQGRWPVDLSAATETGRYDVYMIGDVDAAAIGEENLRRIAERINEGSGLLMIGGFHNFDAGGYAGSPLADPLPVRMDPKLRVPFNAPPPAAAALEGPVEARITRPHPITQLSSASDEGAIWGELKPLLGATRFLAPKVGPSIEVLLESPQEDPLLVVGQYGAGRTAAFAGDSTWQWWRQGRSDVHRRFWRQMLLWLLARDAPSHDAVWVKMSTRRFSRSEPATFVAGVQGIHDDSQSFDLGAEIIGPDGRRVSVPLLREPAGRGSGDAPLVSGEIPDLAGGLYTLRVEDRNADAEIQPAETLFQVLDIDAELSRPVAEVSRMEQLAALTADAGGRSFRADQIDELLEQIALLRQRAVLPVVEKYRLGEGPISGWLLLVAFVSLLTIEWYLRKRWGLT